MKFNKITITHEWLCQNGGSEKVVANIIKLFKQKQLSVFVMFSRKKIHPLDKEFSQVKISTSILNYIPFIEHLYRIMLPLSIFIQKFIKLDDTDIVISSSHSIIKGISKPKGSMHICYCHTPMRYIWDMYDDYYKLSNVVVKFFMYVFVKYLRVWDVKSSQNVDYFIANSNFVKARILKYYKRDAKVIYPPVDSEYFKINLNKREDFYLCIGRLVPYKRIDLVIDAFKLMPDKKLVVVGDGYLSNEVKREIVNYKNISYIGYQSKENLLSLIQKAKASIFAAKEDFGIGCVESQFCGTPVIALKYGGYLETVTDGLSGYFFEEQNKEEIVNTIHKFELNPLNNHIEIRNSVEKFAVSVFDEAIVNYVNHTYEEFHTKS